MIIFEVLSMLLKCLFLSKRNKEFSISRNNLFQKSFRIKEKQNKSYSFFFRFFFFVLKAQLAKKQVSHVLEKETACFYDDASEAFKARRDYLKIFLRKEVNSGVFKNELLHSLSLINFLALILLFPLLLPFLFYKENKGSVAIIFAEFIEAVNLVKHLNRNSITEVYYFSIFHKDSNFTYLVLKKFGIKVNKITSEVPLHLWNSSIITDELILCSAYQLEEIKYFANTMLYNEVKLWGPENVALYDHLYKSSKDNQTESKTIGFYSTANWYRKKENDLLDFEGADECEIMVIKEIKQILSVTPGLKLKLYLHPKEKSKEQIKNSLDFYSTILGEIKYEIANLTQPTSTLFNTCDIAIALNSTIIYERLYYGFKTLIMPLGYSDFPINSASIKNICCLTGLDLQRKIKESLLIDAESFFAINNIQNYRKLSGAI